MKERRTEMKGIRKDRTIRSETTGTHGRTRQIVNQTPKPIKRNDEIIRVRKNERKRYKTTIKNEQHYHNKQRHETNARLRK